MRIKLIIILAATGMLSTSFMHNKEQWTVSDLKEVEVLSKEKDSILMWNTDRKLVWDDFLGKGDKRSGYAALTSSKIGIETEWYDDSVLIVVPTYFDHHKSWVLEKTNDLLDHEQGHFDITEIISRMIRKDLSDLNFTNMTITSRKISTIYKKHTLHTWDSYNKYDRETKHGTVQSKQSMWLKKIDQELDDLKAYSSDTVVIRR